MALNDAGIWTPDDTEIISPPGNGIDDILARMADSIARPEGTITQPWRIHYRTTSSNIPNATFTDISTSGWAAGAGDPGSASGITHSTDGYTVTQAGWYRIELDVGFDPNSSNARQAQIRINGNIERTVNVQAVAGGSSTTASVAIERPLVAADIVSFWARQTSGVTLGSPIGSDASRKFIRLIALL